MQAYFTDILLVPSGHPLNVRVKPASTSAVLAWDPPDPQHQNGVIMQYSIAYLGEEVSASGNGSRVFQMIDLIPLKQYSVLIAAVTSNGTGPATVFNFTTMPKGIQP